MTFVLDFRRKEQFSTIFLFLEISFFWTLGPDFALEIQKSGVFGNFVDFLKWKLYAGLYERKFQHNFSFIGNFFFLNFVSRFYIQNSKNLSFWKNFFMFENLKFVHDKKTIHHNFSFLNIAFFQILGLNFISKLPHRDYLISLFLIVILNFFKHENFF